MSRASDDVLAERDGQIAREGFLPMADDQYVNGELAAAAACYVINSVSPLDDLDGLWPWDIRWWKPKDKRRDLVRAAALLVAEIERLDRLAARENDSHAV